MNRYTLKMLLRSIRASLGRYLAILAIVALGVGFFAGLKCSMPAMVSTADEYLRRQHMYDFRLLSTLGFTPEDETAFRELEGVSEAEGAYFADAAVESGEERFVVHFASVTKRVAVPLLTAGRMPENPGECLADDAAFAEKDLGRVLTVSADNETDTLEMLTRDGFTIVGLARSPRYISVDRGTTSLGSGSVKGFVLLLPEAFDSEAFHEMLLWCDLPGEIYSETYSAARDRMETGVKSTLTRRGQLRYESIRADAEAEFAKAQKEIDDGWAEYTDGVKKLEDELADGRARLEEARAELNDGWRAVTEGRRQLEEGMAAIPAAKAEIERNRQTLAESEAQLAVFRSLLDAAKTELNNREQELRELLEREDAAKYAALADYYEAVIVAQAEVTILEGEIEAIRSGQGDESLLPQLEARLADARERLARAQEELEAAEAAYDPDTAEIVDVEAIIARIHAYAEELEAQLAEGERALAEGKAQLAAAEAQIAAAERDYPENLRRLKEAEAKLMRGEAELKQGWADYEEGKVQGEAELADARQKLLDAEQELADAREEFQSSLRLEVYTLDRSANAGYVTFENDTGIVDAIANAFPIFFVLIAALVCTTTMTRMVNDERTLIGTMKAMGYGSGVIMSKYLLYSGSSALLGCLGGYFLGTVAIPRTIWIAYNIAYHYASLEYFFDPVIYCLCLAVAVPGTLLVTWLACRSELTGRPAELIRPKAPAVGKRILLEYIKPVWNRMSFLSKVTVRNAFRYRLRVVMMLLGIGGCTALMVAGYGVKDSIADISHYQYEEILLYDLEVTLDPDRITDTDAAALWDGETESWAFVRKETAEVSKDGDAVKSVRLVAAAEGDLEGLISLHTASRELAWPGKGEAVLTEKIAHRLKAQPGDQIRVRLDSGESAELTVTGICKNYLNHFIYVSPDSLPPAERNTALLKVREDAEADYLAASLRSAEGVEYVSQTARERDTIEQSMASLDLLVLMLVVCSGILAFITLYNLTNINIMERTREIATVKVLGFLPGETASYILRENLMLSTLGAAAGMLLGKLLHRFVLELVDVEGMTFDVRIFPRSYIIAFLITIAFAVGTNAFMRLKLEKVNMAESLKSVE